MENKNYKTYIIGVLLITIFSSSIFILFDSKKVSLEVLKDKSIFRVYKNGEFIISGVEYTKLYKGSKLLKPINSKLEHYTYNNINRVNLMNKSYIKRYTFYENNISVIDSYLFDGDIDRVEQFPISHEIIIKNGKGLTLLYEIRKLKYDGETKKVTKNVLHFGNNMKVEYNKGFYYSKIYKSGILKVKYKINSNLKKYNVRLFDPLPKEPKKYNLLYSCVNKTKYNIVKYPFSCDKSNISCLNNKNNPKYEYKYEHYIVKECKESGINLSGKIINYVQEENICQRYGKVLCCYLKSDGGLSLPSRDIKYRGKLKSGETGICINLTDYEISDYSNHQKKFKSVLKNVN